MRKKYSNGSWEQQHYDAVDVVDVDYDDDDDKDAVVDGNFDTRDQDWQGYMTMTLKKKNHHIHYWFYY